MKEKTACFTGHRDIPQSELKQISKALKKAICEAYENGYRCFGSDCVRQAFLLKDQKLTTFDPYEKNIIHPVSYFR